METVNITELLSAIVLAVDNTQFSFGGKQYTIGASYIPRESNTPPLIIVSFDGETVEPRKCTTRVAIELFAKTRSNVHEDAPMLYAAMDAISARLAEELPGPGKICKPFGLATGLSWTVAPGVYKYAGREYVGAHYALNLTF